MDLLRWDLFLRGFCRYAHPAARAAASKARCSIGRARLAGPACPASAAAALAATWRHVELGGNGVVAFGGGIKVIHLAA